MGYTLKVWSKRSFDNLGKQIEDAEKLLRAAQQNAISKESCEECEKYEALLDDLNRKHEAYWYLRSRVLEFKDGDRNTSYFHQKTS